MFNREVVLAFLAVFIWSGSAAVAYHGGSNVNYAALTICIGVLGGLSFSIIGFIFSTSIEQDVNELQSEDNIKQFLLYCFCSCFCLLLYQLLYLYAIQSPVSVQANIINYLWPLFTPIVAVYILKIPSRNFTIYDFGALLIAFLGCYIVLDGSINTITKYHIASFTGAILSAFYLGFFLKASQLQENVILVFIVGYITSTPIIIIFIYILSLPLIITFEAVPYVLYLGVISSTIAHISWNTALRDGDTVIISSIAYLTPLSSTIVLIPVAGIENSIFLVLTGAFLIILGQILTNKK